jgi:hypothetical protein
MPDRKNSQSMPCTCLKFYYSIFFFLQNHGTVSDLPSVLVLRPETLDDQINHVCSLFLKQEMSIDRKKRMIMLPKVCEV